LEDLEHAGESRDLGHARVRRIVTGHDAGGRSIVVEDAEHAGTGLAEDDGRSDASFVQLWATHEMPVSLTDASMAQQREGSMTTVVGSGSGSVLRIGALAPGARSPRHRTESLDYGICLEGECDLELDGGEVLTVRAGDVVIQRGTNHVWHNRGSDPCRFAWVLLDAEAYRVDGRELRTSWKHQDTDDPRPGGTT
jgi:quercetin dioxygenase-like cupin family protein